MDQLKGLYLITVVLALAPFQTAFADVGDITVSEVEFMDPCAGGIYEVACGSPVILSVTLTNDRTQPLSYVAFLEVRDSNNVTIYLEFHKGRLDAGVLGNIGSSWIPNRPGEYELRVFAISDFENPEILSRIGSNTTRIS